MHQIGGILMKIQNAIKIHFQSLILNEYISKKKIHNLININCMHYILIVNLEAQIKVKTKV